MKGSLFNQRVKLINIIVLVVLGVVIGSSLLCSCGAGSREGFSLAQSAPINYNIGAGVPGSWENSASSSSTQSAMFASLQGNQGTPVPLPEGEMFYFSGNKFSGGCCTGPVSSYSNSNGCACMSLEQAQYLNQRGGNRTYASQY